MRSGSDILFTLAGFAGLSVAEAAAAKKKKVSAQQGNRSRIVERQLNPNVAP